MGLSCYCPEWDGEPGSWYYFSPDDFSIFEGSRRKRCSSCGELIDIGAECLEFRRGRAPREGIEERIWDSDEPIMIASYFMCKKCGEIYFNLEAAGYCFGPSDNMKEALQEYWKLTGFTPTI
ncbi:MAG: hypothetical protein ACFFCW_30755 [Candidatus Hodarchaeota archaeon]